MNEADVIAAFWQEYLDTLPEGQRPLSYTAGSFGDNPALADELAALVMAGHKTATCGALWEYEADLELLPKVGELSIIKDGQGRPLCIVETVEVTVTPYSAVDARFAFDEGEGDRSLAYWREAHWRFFSRTLPRIGRQASEDMPLVCKRFRRVYP
jgi:uncharacterized protein YhfF